MSAVDDLARRVRLAARAMGRHGLAHAYGHVSQRLDGENLLVTPSKPLGTVLPGEACTVVPIDGPLPDGVLGEVRIHQQIYKARPDVGGVARVQSPHVIALSALGRTPRPLHGLGTYFAPAPPLWDDPLLLRSDEQAAALVATMDGTAAVVMRGNGSVTAGADLRQAACLAFFLEDAARMELLAGGLAAGAPQVYSEAQVRARAVTTGGLFERMWDYLTFGDPEA